MTIRYVQGEKRAVDSSSGEYLTTEFIHRDHPTRNYTIHAADGSRLVTATVQQKDVDLSGDGRLGIHKVNVLLMEEWSEGAASIVTNEHSDAARRLARSLKYFFWIIRINAALLRSRSISAQTVRLGAAWTVNSDWEANVRLPPLADIDLAHAGLRSMTIRFDPKSRRTVDCQSGEYLERGRYHYQDPLQHYSIHDEDGECLLIADVEETRVDTTGDNTVDLVEAAVFRVFSRRFYDGKMTRVWSRWHPAARRFAEFYRIYRPGLQIIPPNVVISWKLWSALPKSVR